jgi:hypothetical protein
MDPKVNDDFLVWLNKLHGNYGAVKATRGDRHEYLGMVLDSFKRRCSEQESFPFGTVQ